MNNPRKKIGKATTSQILAANPTRSVWVSANAGTGKTRVLVDRIARLLLSGCAPEKILCLTFTKTAAAEMAERINHRLGGWVIMNDADLKAELTDLSQNKPDIDTMDRARTLFARVLEAPGGLKIRTIHSFAESLLARFPLEAGVAPHFTVIDERTASELMNAAQNNVLEKSYLKKDLVLPAAMHHLAELVNEESFAKLMRELTSAKSNLNHILTTYGDGLDDAITKMVGLEQSESTIEKIIENACEDTAFDHPGLHRVSEALSHGAKTSKENSATLNGWLKAKIKSRTDLFLKSYASIFTTTKGEARAESRLSSKGVNEFDAGALEILLTEQTRVMAVLEKIKCAQTANATRALLTVGRAIQKEYEILKRGGGVLDYDDLIEKACGLLGNEDSASWVHFKLDGGIDHILVDESQDTSPAQWIVVKGLAGDFFSGRGRVDENTRTVFAVGDEKQSIYSFQGADPYEFGRMAEYFEKRVTDAGSQFTPLQLITSFRSTNAVLKTVDVVFDSPVAFDGLSFKGEKVLHKSHRQGEAGLVELWQPELPENAIDADPWDAPLDRLSFKSPQTKLAERIATTIKGWFDNNEILESKGRPIRPDDILILVRRRGVFADEMIRQLKLNGVEVAGSDRMVLTDQIAVEDLMALGNFCLLPEDDLNTATLLKSPLIGINEEQLLELANGRTKTIWSELKKLGQKDGAYKDAFKILSGHLGRADYQPPYEFFADVLNKGGRKQLMARLGSDAEDPMDEFLSLALQFERTHTPSLQGFLHWVKSGATEIKRDMEITGAKVRIMTVHGAKGLEANIVFLPDTCAKPAHQHDNKIHWETDIKENPLVLWSPVKEMRTKQVNELIENARSLREREYRRLLYVAMTRAADRLYIGGYASDNGPAEGSWYELMESAVKKLGKEIKTPEGIIWRYELKQQADVGKDTPSLEIPMTPLPNWALNPAAVEQTPVRPLSPSIIDAGDSTMGPFDGDGDKSNAMAFKRGLAVHKLLEILPGLDGPTRVKAGEHWLGQTALGLTQNEITEILSETMAVLENETLAPLFANNAMAEAPIIGRVGEHIISGRIDRLVVNDDEVMIIDYKTNRQPPENAAEIHPAYLRQMAIYKTLLAEIYPKRRIRAFLLWTHGAKTMEIPPQQLDGVTIS